MEQENALLAQQQAQQQQQMAIDQQAQQQQDMENQIAFGAQQQVAQAQVDKEVQKISGPDQGPGKAETAGRDHESNMMDKKIKLAQIQSKKSAPPAKKKTVAEQAKDLELVYIGGGQYATSSGIVTHLNENGKLIEAK